MYSNKLCRTGLKGMIKSRIDEPQVDFSDMIQAKQNPIRLQLSDCVKQTKSQKKL